MCLYSYVYVCVCVARVKSKSFVLHKSAGSSSDVRTNRAALSAAAGWKEGETGERNTERERVQDSSCQASVAHLSHRK